MPESIILCRACGHYHPETVPGTGKICGDWKDEDGQPEPQCQCRRYDPRPTNRIEVTEPGDTERRFIEKKR